MSIALSWRVLVIFGAKLKSGHPAFYDPRAIALQDPDTSDRR